MNEDKIEYVFDQHSSQSPQVISMTQERYDQAIAEARAAEREACYRDVCLDCAKGTPIDYWPLVDRYTHVVNDFRHACTANAIRQRWAAQEQAG